MSKLRVGFIGLGLMGNPMAKNILKKGFPLSVYNRTKQKCSDFKKLGVNIYDSPAQLAQNSDVVISMITGPKDVSQVYLGAQGVAKGAGKGLIAIDMSTIGPSAAKEVAKGLKKVGVNFLDAPVTGSTEKATTGELSIFVGGNEQILEKVKPVLEAMGTNIVYMGGSGFGQSQKLVNNLLVGLTTESLAEAFLLGESLGLKRAQVAQALQNVFAVSPGMKGKMPFMVNRKYPTAFSVSNIRKDLKLALDESAKTQKKLPLLKVAEQLYKIGMDLGYSNKDLSAIAEVLYHRK